jgi:hypothetical protein
MDILGIDPEAAPCGLESYGAPAAKRISNEILFGEAGCLKKGRDKRLWTPSPPSKE